MDRQQIGLKLALDAVGQDLDLSDFDRRLILQKTVYLIQAARVDLGYAFRWYLRGPYSPALTRDAFALRAELAGDAEEVRDWTLDRAAGERLARLRATVQSLPAAERSRRLELLASVHFLLATRQARDTDVAGLRQVLLSNKKDFTEEEICQAVEDLRAHDLFPPSGP